MKDILVHVTVTAPSGVTYTSSYPVDEPNSLLLGLLYAAAPGVARLRDLPGDPYGLRDMADRLNTVIDDEYVRCIGEGVRAERFEEAMRRMLREDT